MTACSSLLFYARRPWLWLLPTLLGVLGAAPATAQRRPAALPAPPPPGAPVQTARVELKLESYNSEVHVQPLAADSSVVLLVGQDARLEADRLFTFQHYDQHLRLRRESVAPVPPEFRYARGCTEGQTVFAVFRSNRLEGRLWTVAYDGRSGAVRTQQFDTRLSREIVDLKALDGRLFANVLLAGGQHVTALLLDVPTGQMRYLPAVYEPLPTQLSFATDAAHRRAEYVVSQTNGRKSRLLLKQVSAGGQLLHSQYVQAESDRSLITAQLAPARDSAARLLTGTYSLRDPAYAQGLFATDLSAVPDGQRAPLRFYDFLNLKHFFDYLTPSRQARLRQRIGRRVARASPPLRWHYRLLLHELLPRPDGSYVLVAEAYFPHYHYNSSGYSPGLGHAGGFAPAPYGLGYPNSRVFDGYQTTHALVCGFDAHGALLWDNVFVAEDLRRYDLEEAVRVQPLPDGRLALTYLDDDHIRYKLINGAAPAPDDLRVPLQTNGANRPEKVFEAEQNDLLPWFGSQFVASGYQRIRPAKGPERRVFFLNAVAF